MPKPPFNYHKFLTAVKIYTFETVSALIVIFWLIDHAIKEIRPAVEHILKFFSSS